MEEALLCEGAQGGCGQDPPWKREEHGSDRARPGPHGAECARLGEAGVSESGVNRREKRPARAPDHRGEAAKRAALGVEGEG